MTPSTVNFLAVTLLKSNTKYTEYVNLLKSGLTTEQAVVKLKLSKSLPTEIEKYQYLQQKQIWKQEQMSSLKDILRCYNNKDVVPTLEAMQKCFLFTESKVSMC